MGIPSASSLCGLNEIRVFKYLGLCLAHCMCSISTLTLIIPVSGEPDTRRRAIWWKYVCLSPYWPLTSATPTLILPLHQTHHTHSPGISLLYSFPQSLVWNAFSPQLGDGVLPRAWFESQTWFEFWLCHFLAAWSWAGYSKLSKS